MDRLASTPHEARSTFDHLGFHGQFFTNLKNAAAAAPPPPTQFAKNDLVVPPPFHLAFVYGTLKKGFGNHWLMEELMSSGHARYLGSACTQQKYPLVCGPFCVPFLLHIPAAGHHVRGEVYQVDDTALAKLDDREGVNKGHYVRRPVLITELQLHPGTVLDGFHPTFLNSMIVLAEAYFAAADYTPGMSRAAYIDCYSEKEASSYVRRNDRPEGRTFLEHIRAWIKDQQSADCGQH